MIDLKPILYAEDDENDRELTLAALSDCGIDNRIDVVNDGQEVLDYLNYNGKYQDRKNESPILILLDIKMPKVDGIQVLEVIKSDDRYKAIPVVMLTSSSLEQDLLKSYNLGANAFVVKPVDFDEFFEAVKRVGVFWALVNKTS
jgi:two-component system, response regulator